MKDIEKYKEIFNSPLVEAIERELIWTGHDCERVGGEQYKEAVRSLLRVRKRVLDELFAPTAEHKRLLEEFNQAAKAALIKTRTQTINTYRALRKGNCKGDIEVNGYCFLGYEYPAMHPIQTDRAKKVWDILSGVIDHYMPSYNDGISVGYRIQSMADCERIIKEDEEIWMSDNDNWNEGLDMEWTKDMHLIHACHKLNDTLDFSTFDSLWVRKFEVEVTVDIDLTV